MFLHVSVILFTGWGSRPIPREEVVGSGLGWSRPIPRGEVGGSGWGGCLGPHPGGRLGGLAGGCLGPYLGGGWGVWPGGCPGPHPGGSRSTPGGVQAQAWEGDVQAQAQRGVSQHALGQTTPPQLLECILVYRNYGQASVCHTWRWRIQDFPEEGAPTPRGGAPTCDFAKFSQKLHEIERIWTPRGGARPKFYYVDPPLHEYECKK